jgi:8-oxo-dGTP pyrophosphatase MutT (NUDIX family)
MKSLENTNQLPERPSSRLLIVNQDSRLLLFKFHYRDGALAGRIFWATPGGGLDSDESYEAAARREIWRKRVCASMIPVRRLRSGRP